MVFEVKKKIKVESLSPIVVFVEMDGGYW